MRTLLEPDFVVDVDGHISSGPVLIDDGRVVASGPTASAAVVDHRLPLSGKALLPAFGNVHSHAFQRGLRGRVERRDAGHAEDDFWTWREAMYRLATHLDLSSLRAVSALCFLEMLESGCAFVGEFHYLHRVEGSAAVETSAALVGAARRVGLKPTLLEVAYERAGAGLPPTEAQRAFAYSSAPAFLAHVDETRAKFDDDAVIGVAIHSVRACSRPWIEAVADYAQRHTLPLHVHACEQRRELVECQNEHGLSPIALLDSCGALGPGTTVVHATHLSDDDVARLGGSGAGVCVCPTTERNLGDGLAPLASLQRAGVPLSVGTDSHARIDLVDELRALEEHERLRLEKRALLAAPGSSLSSALVPAATAHARTALGRAAVRLSPDLASGPADLVTLALPRDRGALSAEDAMDAVWIGGNASDVRDVFKDGVRVLADRRPTHVDADALAETATQALRRVLPPRPAAPRRDEP